MSVLLAAALAGAAAAAAVGLPSPGRVRLQDVAPAPAVPGGPRRPVLPAAVVAVAAVLLLGAVGAVVLLLAATAVVRSEVARRRRRAVAAERAGMTEACAVLAAELAAGRAPAAALAAAADVAAGAAGRALRSAAAAADLGGDVAATLTGDADASAVGRDLRALAACWTVCAASGSGLAAAVLRLEEGLRAQAAQRRAVDAELAGPRASAALLAVLPAVGLLMGAGLGADPLHVLLHTPLGLGCLVLGVVLEGLGVLWTGRLVTHARGAC